jgi:type I restriction enzyme S subunit
LKLLAFEEVVRDASAGNAKVQKGDYLSSGRYPIIDQGQDFIGGYTDEESNLVAGDGPWIVFGDHTRALKFVEFPFCMGADGVKILKLKDEKAADLKYVCRFLESANIPSAGYSRHYKFLKRLGIPLPPLNEQKRIAAILDKADQLRQKRRQAIALLDSLTQSMFLERFGDPISNPKGFPTRELQEIVDPIRKITYGILMPGPDIANGVPYIRVVDMRDGLVLMDQLRRTTTEIAQEYRRSSLKAGDVLISIRGHVGRLAVTPPECDGANITQDTARLAIVGANALYVSALLATGSAQHWMAQRTKGVAVRGINLGDLKKFPVMLPEISEQKEFARQIEQIIKVMQLKDAQLKSGDSLFSSLQRPAFTGQL